MPTTTNYGWTTPADTDLVKDGASAIRTLGTAIDTTVFNNAGAAIAKTIVDAKGDLIVATAADTVARLASSATNGDLLTVDTSTATGLKWATPVSGGLTLISEQSFSSGTTMDFTSISGTYKQLMLVWQGCSFSNNTGSTFSVRLNADSATNYADIVGSVAPGGNSTATGGFITAGSSIMYGKLFGELVTSLTQNLNNSPRGYLLIDNYASTTKLKNYKYEASYCDGDREYLKIGTGSYNSTSAITQINILRLSGSATITNIANTTVRLYGVA